MAVARDSLSETLSKTLGASFRVDRELAGNRRASRIFLVYDASARMDVVVTVVSPAMAKGLDHERFARELAKLRRLLHPNIVPVLATGIVVQLPYYTMPWVDAESARAALDTRGRLGVRESVALLRDVARALEFMHAQGFVHGDLKPDNVLLGANGAVVSDVGIAPAIAAARNEPEMDLQDDLHAWGALAYELLTERAPAGAAPVTSKRDDIPAPLSRLIMQCLEKEPEQRPMGAGELVYRLEAISRSVGPSTPRRIKA
jgi:serine/threonine-protein kinase